MKTCMNSHYNGYAVVDKKQEPWTLKKIFEETEDVVIQLFIAYYFLHEHFELNNVEAKTLENIAWQLMLVKLII